jgi:hypothetical protein
VLYFTFVELNLMSLDNPSAEIISCNFAERFMKQIRSTTLNKNFKFVARNCGSSVSIVTKLHERSSIPTRGNEMVSSLHHRGQAGSGAHPASYIICAWGFLLGEKRLGRETNYSPPSSAEVKNAWSYTPNPQYVFMAF